MTHELVTYESQTQIRSASSLSTPVLPKETNGFFEADLKKIARMEFNSKLATQQPAISSRSFFDHSVKSKLFFNYFVKIVSIPAD